MKKIIVASILAFLLSFTVITSVMAATAEIAVDENELTEQTDDIEPVVKEIEPVKVVFTKDRVKKTAGQKFKLKASVNKDDLKPVYKTTDKKVLTVNRKSGKVFCKKAGSAKVIAYCNGAMDVCKITVMPGKIEGSEMKDIEAKVGHQTQYAYGSSSIMCSAYSFAYAYYQVTGTYRAPGSFWYGGGCTWDGGTYKRCSSSSEMLSTIKSEIDQGKACVGLTSRGYSSTHYVTFYGYTGDGTKLSDYKIIDPWDGELRTGSQYSYSYGGYHVATINK